MWFYVFINLVYVVLNFWFRWRIKSSCGSLWVRKQQCLITVGVLACVLDAIPYSNQWIVLAFHHQVNLVLECRLVLCPLNLFFSFHLLAITLKSILQQLPLNDTDEEAWEMFLQSERINSLVESLFTIDYNTMEQDGDNHNYKIIAGALAEILKFLREQVRLRVSVASYILTWRIINICLTTHCIVQNAVDNDAFFWNTLKHLSCQDEKSVNDDCHADLSTESVFFPLDPVRSLLLLLVQCICDEKPEISLVASELFLLLCRVII